MRSSKCSPVLVPADVRVAQLWRDVGHNLDELRDRCVLPVHSNERRMVDVPGGGVFGKGICNALLVVEEISEIIPGGDLFQVGSVRLGSDGAAKRGELVIIAPTKRDDGDEGDSSSSEAHLGC